MQHDFTKVTCSTNLTDDAATKIHDAVALQVAALRASPDNTWAGHPYPGITVQLTDTSSITNMAIIVNIEYANMDVDVQEDMIATVTYLQHKNKE